MISLNATTQKLQVVLAGAITTNQLDIDVTYREDDLSSLTPMGAPAKTNNSTAVDIVAAPGASNVSRLIDFVSVYNTDTASATVTVQKDVSGTKYILHKCVLGVGEKLEYTDFGGWKVITSSGAVKTSQNQGNNPTGSTINVAVLGADVTNNNAVANTIADVTGLSFPVVNGKKYWFRFVIQYTSAATTTGSRWSINGPGGTMKYRSDYTLTSIAQTINEGLTTHDAPSLSSASSLTAANNAIIEGFYEASADGTVIARFASEVSSSAIVAKAGSFVQYLEVL